MLEAVLSKLDEITETESEEEEEESEEESARPKSSRRSRTASSQKRISSRGRKSAVVSRGRNTKNDDSLLIEKSDKKEKQIPVTQPNKSKRRLGRKRNMVEGDVESEDEGEEELAMVKRIKKSNGDVEYKK